MKISNNKNISKVIWCKRIICFMLGCMITALLILGFSCWPLSSHKIRYFLNAEIISFSDDVLKVKGLPTNPEYMKGIYLINVSDDLSFKDRKTGEELEWEAVRGYKYITVEYIGREEPQDNSYLKNIVNIYCNGDKRIP